MTLPEATPVYEASRLEGDLERAGLHVDWWVVNQSFVNVPLTSPILKQKQKTEVKWVAK